MTLKLLSRKKNGKDKKARKQVPRQATPFVPSEPVTLEDDPLKQYLQLGRYGIIVANRDRWRKDSKMNSIYQAAAARVDDQFVLVPEGFASLPKTVNDYAGCPELDIETNPFLLARCPVTNAEYQNFVDAGGYEDLELWPKDIWPHLIDFVDQAEQPGPRYWRDGRYDKHLAEHPVVGINYYEAVAYSRWAGYRLPTEAEWQMSASWRIRSSAHVLRRYPWGDAFDSTRCNIWAAGVGETVPVNSYESGAAPNGALQLIGNVWEWTGSNFEVTDDEGRLIVGDMLMKAIRGGAFDTYFSCQATSCFRTGAASLARTRNMGFRCVMNA